VEHDETRVRKACNRREKCVEFGDKRLHAKKTESRATAARSTNLSASETDCLPRPVHDDGRATL